MGLYERAKGLGLEVSLRTAQRVLGGNVAEAVLVGETFEREARKESLRPTGVGTGGSEGPILRLGDEDLSELLAVLRGFARSSYLDLAGISVEGRPGEILIKARVYEPEEEYEDD